jgi:hypothetical protein
LFVYAAAAAGAGAVYYSVCVPAAAVADFQLRSCPVLSLLLLLLQVEAFGLRHLEQQVPDPALRSRLTPSYSVGCKRM